jgi:hypothetical protein
VTPDGAVGPGKNGPVTIRWFTDADRAERARVTRERLERDELLMRFAEWLADRAEHGGPVTLPELTPESEARLIRLLQEGIASPGRAPNDCDSP